MKYYDISVIIPIYNAEKYLKKTIKSLINQDYDFRKIEVLLINDGSQDNSLKICEEYSKKYSNIKVFTGENQGVSYARNIGIKNATGAYITFLDADDSISNNTIKALIQFFDQNFDKVDIITYPVYYVKNNKTVPHVKNNFFKKSGIYEANDRHYFPASTINVIVKNKKNIIFDETLTTSEDCNFNIKQIMIKEKIGFCKDASYYYLKHDDSKTKTGLNPYYVFDAWIDLCEFYTNTYIDNNNKLKLYIQMMLLYEINWKLIGDILFPTHLKDKQFQIAKKRIINIIKHIDDTVILNCPHIDKFHKHYLISLKNNEITYNANENELIIFSNGTKIVTEKSFEIVINRFKVINNKLHIIGFYKSIVYNYINPVFYIVKNGIKSKINVKLSTHSNYKCKTQTNNFYAFDIIYNIDEINEIKFLVEIDNKEYKTHYYFMPNMIIDKKMGRTSFLYKNNKIEVTSNNIIIINKITNEKIKEIKKLEFDKYKKINQNINFYRFISNIYTKKKIWLYNDREGIIDNAYYQFKHDLYKKDNIKRYYISSDSKKNLKNKFTKKELKYVIKFKSLRHKILFLNSSKILTSFNNLEFFSPFVNSLKWYVDLLKYQIIYLQHGVLHCHTPWIYSKEVTHVDKIVISSNFEYNNFIDNYSYNSKDLIISGMPRLDIIKNQEKKSNPRKILIALSWRVNLMGGYKEGKYEANVNKYLQSEYYKELTKLLESKKFHQLISKNNIEVDIMPHPIFKVYNEYFKITNKSIKIISEAIPNNYNLIITDYSSIVFDYVYFNIPVIYFVPDYILYKARITHIYNKLDLPMEYGFGPLTISVNNLIKELSKFIDNNYKLEEKYINKSQDFFISKENHRENLYKELIED